MKQTMTAYAAVTRGDLQPVTLPIPAIDDYEALIQNEGCVFCNTTDRMIVEEGFAAPAYPVVLGHENFGKVIRVGKKVTAFREGDRVICANAIVRGFDGTFHSAWGGFSEFGVAGDLQAFLRDGGVVSGPDRYRSRYAMNHVIDASLPAEQAALVFSLAECSDAMRQVGDLHGKHVVVVGTGFVGYALVFLAKRAGAASVLCLGRRAERLPSAKAMGADAAFCDIEEAAAFYRPFGGADIVIEASGNPQVFAAGIPYLKEGGRLCAYAVATKPYVYDEARTPNHIASRIDPGELGALLPGVTEMLRENRFPISEILTHRWDFSEVPEAYAAVRRGEVIKGLVTIGREHG